MPFTPLHMGPGILIKSVMQGSFSLMVFGWTQILMDIQPLYVMLSHKGTLHGFTHTYLGASLVAAVSVFSGKYLAELGLRILAIKKYVVKISWKVAVISSFIGSFSHVWLDNIMHSDIRPFAPFSQNMSFYGWLTIEQLHYLCLYSGLTGAVIFFSLEIFFKKVGERKQMK